MTLGMGFRKQCTKSFKWWACHLAPVSLSFHIHKMAMVITRSYLVSNEISGAYLTGKLKNETSWF